MRLDAAGGGVAVERAECGRNDCVALVKVIEQGARGVRGLIRKREIRGYRAEQRRWTRGAPGLLEHQNDLAQSPLGSVCSEGGEALPGHCKPQICDSLGIVGILNRFISRPNLREQVAYRSAQQRALGIRNMRRLKG